MKIAGIIVTVIGALMVLSSASLAFTKYNLSDSHDLSKFLGGAGFSVLVLVIGLALVKRSLKGRAGS
ncbi:MAG: hypothetical protein ACYC26_14305 [Phycisphaerales bacterium]